MKISEFKRLLKSLGASFEEGTRHTKVYLNGKQSTLPRHATQEIGEALRHAMPASAGSEAEGQMKC